MKSEFVTFEHDNTLIIIVVGVELCTIYDPKLELITNIQEIRQQNEKNMFSQWVNPENSSIEFKVTGTVSKLTQVMFEEEQPIDWVDSEEEEDN